MYVTAIIISCVADEHCSCITPKAPNRKIVEFVNRVDPDEVAHNEPPHLDLHCLPSSLEILNMI